MSLRFRKSIKLGKGIKLNINKKSVGLTGGVRGAHYTVNSKSGRTKSFGIPGTGISWRSSSGGSSSSKSVPHFGPIGSLLFYGIIICIIVFIALYAWIPTAIVGIIYIIYCLATKSEITKKYIVIGSLVFAISLGAFIFYSVNKGKTPPPSTVSPQSTSSTILSSRT